MLNGLTRKTSRPRWTAGALAVALLMQSCAHHPIVIDARQKRASRSMRMSGAHRFADIGAIAKQVAGIWR